MMCDEMPEAVHGDVGFSTAGAGEDLHGSGGVGDCFLLGRINCQIWYAVAFRFLYGSFAGIPPCREPP